MYSTAFVDGTQLLQVYARVLGHLLQAKHIHVHYYVHMRILASGHSEAQKPDHRHILVHRFHANNWEMHNLIINRVHYLIHKQSSLVSQIMDHDLFIVLIKISVEKPMNLLPLSNKHHIGNQKLSFKRWAEGPFWILG